MKNIVTLALKLFVITVVAGLLLGVAYAATKDPIAAQEKKDSDLAKKRVFSGGRRIRSGRSYAAGY